MRAQTITTMTRRRRYARRRLAALALGIAALAIPATANAQVDRDRASVNANAHEGPAPVLTEDQAFPGLAREARAAAATERTATTLAADGLDWGSAAVGAGMAMAIVALGGAGFLTARRRMAGSGSIA